MYIKLPELSNAGWTLKKETSEHVIYAAPAPYRLLMFIPKSIATAVPSATVDASIGWHYDRHYVAGAYTLSENVGMKHTKITVRQVVADIDDPVTTMSEIFAKTPRNDGKRAQGGGRKPTWQEPKTSTTISIATSTLDQVKFYATEEGKDVSKIINEAISLYLNHKNAGRTPGDHFA
ncbi:MAG: hypothetical protein ACOYNY_20300 [Caldilineaceae bacterium]|jgi:hypothetical protein